MSSVTIRDIAKALNIAPSTVSSCLNGDTEKRRISQKRIDEVRKKADEMGYIPNQRDMPSYIMREKSSPLQITR